MCTITAASLGRAVKHVQLADAAAQVRHGHLTLAGLMDLRARLDSREFGCEHARALQVAVCEALAVLRGIPVEDDPLYREIVPEPPADASGLLPG